MNLSEFEIDLLNLTRRQNRPLINILTLNFFLNYISSNGKQFSLLLRSCAFFYKFCIDNPEIFALLETFTATTLPWNTGSMQERENWLYSGYGEDENVVLRERMKLLWFHHLDHWYEVFFQNPHFYLRWSEEDGWGWYLRHDVNDIRVILNSTVMQNSTFVESIQESDMEILMAFGFRSFFRYTNNPGSQSSDWWICYGLLWFANSCDYSPISFDHLYDCFQVDDPDSVTGLPYRSMVQWYRRVWNEVICLTFYKSINNNIKGNRRRNCSST